jgi:hypothetical protein
MLPFIENADKISRGEIPRPSRQSLFEAVLATYEELHNRARHLPRLEAFKEIPQTAKFFGTCYKQCGEKLMVIKKLEDYLVESLSIQRDLTELVVDCFWMASYLQESRVNAEKLSTRFFKMLNKNYLGQFELVNQIMPNDPFVKGCHNQTERERNLKTVSADVDGYLFIDPKASTSLRKEQGKNWRAHPELINDINQIKWPARCERAKTLSEGLYNLQDAPYLKNLTYLSSYTHWDPVQTGSFTDCLLAGTFDRSLNVALGFSHDILNVYYFLARIDDPPKHIVECRNKFIYFST